MTGTAIHLHIDTLDGMGARFAAAWRAAGAGQAVPGEHVTFLGLEPFMAALSPKRLELLRHLRRHGPMSVRRLAGELARDYKSVHADVARLTAAGLAERTARDAVGVGWDRAVTEVDLAA